MPPLYIIEAATVKEEEAPNVEYQNGEQELLRSNHYSSYNNPKV
jgi:hypothetical protein